MHDRAALGPADVSDEALAAMVAELLGHDRVTLLESRAEPVAYDVPSLTTVSRHWVNGRARTPRGDETFRLFVKHVQAWHHSPFFAFVPPEARDFAAASYPWAIEAAVYRSDLAQRLPEGLSMPRAVGVVDLEPDAVAVWLPAVEHAPVAWDAARHERAAYLLGRLSGSPAVAPLGDVGGFDWHLRMYVEGRVLHDVRPRVHDDATWQHPDVARCFDAPLRDRLRAAADQVEALGDELAAMPRLVAHGDATPGNLLPGTDPDSFVLIDFGFWLPNAVGFDLGQVVGGEAQLGTLPEVALAVLDERCVRAYHQGLADEGTAIDLDVVRRAHALQLFLFAGLPSLPEEGMPVHQVQARAELARHSLDLLDRTS